MAVLSPLSSSDLVSGEGSTWQTGKWIRQIYSELFSVHHYCRFPQRKKWICHTCNIYSVTFWDLRLGKLERCYARLKPRTLTWVIGSFIDSVEFYAYTQVYFSHAIIYFRGSEAQKSSLTSRESVTSNKKCVS